MRVLAPHESTMIGARSLSHHKLSQPHKLLRPSKRAFQFSLSERSPTRRSLVRRNGACRSKQSSSVAERPAENEASASELRERFELKQPNHAKPSSRRWKKTAYLRARKQQLLEIPERERPLGKQSSTAAFESISGLPYSTSLYEIQNTLAC